MFQHSLEADFEDPEPKLETCLAGTDRMCSGINKTCQSRNRVGHGMTLLSRSDHAVNQFQAHIHSAMTLLRNRLCDGWLRVHIAVLLSTKLYLFVVLLLTVHQPRHPHLVL